MYFNGNSQKATKKAKEKLEKKVLSSQLRQKRILSQIAYV